MGFGDMSAETLRAILGGVTVGDGLPVAIIGVLNVSPESFYAGSVHPDPDDLLRAADDMLAADAAAATRAGGADPIETVLRALAESLAEARHAGVPDERIVLDPGIGFLRAGPRPWYERDAAVIARLDRLRVLGRPLCVGVSRKSFIGVLTGRAEPAKRLAGSPAATPLPGLRGAAPIRPPHLAETRDPRPPSQALRAR